MQKKYIVDNNFSNGAEWDIGFFQIGDRRRRSPRPRRVTGFTDPTWSDPTPDTPTRLSQLESLRKKRVGLGFFRFRDLIMGRVKRLYRNEPCFKTLVHIRGLDLQIVKREGVGLGWRHRHGWDVTRAIRLHRNKPYFYDPRSHTGLGFAGCKTTMTTTTM